MNLKLNKNIININIKKPIEPTFYFTKEKLKHRDHIYKAIKNGDLNFISSTCFCGAAEKTITIDNYDAWGLNIPTVVCSKCCAIRSEYILDNNSIKKFYTKGYYRPHTFTTQTGKGGVGMELNEYYDLETRKGQDIFNFVKNNLDLSKVKKVIEIGCGAGGILANFLKIDKKIYGCDWGADLIKLAKKKLPDGEFFVGNVDKFEGKKFDLVILSDIVEHLTAPNNFLTIINKYLNNEKYIYVNVPNFFGIGLNRWNCKIRQYFKIEHAFCYTMYSLNLLMNKNGFKLIHGNEYIRAIYQKKN